MMEWSHARRKYSRLRSAGARSTRALGRLEKIRIIEDLMPLGGSKMTTLDMRTRFAGTLGLISIVRKMRKLLCALRRWRRFSKLDSHEGARCTLVSKIQFPFLAARLMAVSADEKPSGDPIAREVSCWSRRDARDVTRVLASYPGKVTKSSGVVLSDSEVTISSRSGLLSWSQNPWPNTESTKLRACNSRLSSLRTLLTRILWNPCLTLSVSLTSQPEGIRTELRFPRSPSASSFSSSSCSPEMKERHCVGLELMCSTSFLNPGSWLSFPSMISCAFCIPLANSDGSCGCAP
mmetsp:Transcript_1417/g.2069  ORF Transcript_1417/g.2069 Transcript_1417/m.2069 type:complete len:292 (+) Transcript_1417:1518-2393(+)